jgi:hypothetical protein
VVKTHQLTYSPSNTLYAKFERDQDQHFVMQSKVAKEYLDHFQSRIEEVDIYIDNESGKLIWNGYTEGFVGDNNRMSIIFDLTRNVETTPANAGKSFYGGTRRLPS